MYYLPYSFFQRHQPWVKNVRLHFCWGERGNVCILFTAVYVTLNGSRVDNTKPLLLYEDELAFVAGRSLKHGLVCKAPIIRYHVYFPTWYQPRGTPINASVFLNLIHAPIRFYQFFSRGTSRLLTKQLDRPWPQKYSPGLYTCQFRYNRPDIFVPVGIYPRSRGKVIPS